MEGHSADVASRQVASVAPWRDDRVPAALTKRCCPVGEWGAGETIASVGNWHRQAMCQVPNGRYPRPEWLRTTADKRESVTQRGNNRRMAAALCDGCPVIVECLEAALREEAGLGTARCGIRGGLTARERYEISLGVRGQEVDEDQGAIDAAAARIRRLGWEAREEAADRAEERERARWDGVTGEAATRSERSRDAVRAAAAGRLARFGDEVVEVVGVTLRPSPGPSSGGGSLELLEAMRVGGWNGPPVVVEREVAALTGRAGLAAVRALWEQDRRLVLVPTIEAEVLCAQHGVEWDGDRDSLVLLPNDVLELFEIGF